MTLRGGLCPAATCETTVYVERDGRVHQAAKPPNDLGRVEPGALATLDSAIRTADFGSMRSHRFSGTCPTAWDGQEVVVTFAAPSGPETIAACDVAIDWGSPLFVALSAAVRPFVPLPTT